MVGGRARILMRSMMCCWQLFEMVTECLKVKKGSGRVVASAMCALEIILKIGAVGMKSQIGVNVGRIPCLVD
jgi:hypothetical protein